MLRIADADVDSSSTTEDYGPPPSEEDIEEEMGEGDPVVRYYESGVCDLFGTIEPIDATDSD